MKKITYSSSNSNSSKLSTTREQRCCNANSKNSLFFGPVASIFSPVKPLLGIKEFCFGSNINSNLIVVGLFNQCFTYWAYGQNAHALHVLFFQSLDKSVVATVIHAGTQVER